MNHRERILAALLRSEPDRLPWILSMTPPVEKIFQAKTASRISYADYFDFGCRYLELKPSVKPADFSRYYEGRVFAGPAVFDVDFGFANVFPDSGSHFSHYESPFNHKPFTVDDAATYPMPDWDADYRYEDVKSQNDSWHARGYATGSIIGFSTFDLSRLIRGFEPFFMELAAEEEAVLLLMDRITDVIAAKCRRMAALGTEIVGLGDDVGSQRSLIISPKSWRFQIKPRLKKVIDAAKSGNPKVLFFYHSDGQIEDIIPDLIEVGVDILNPIQPECMDPVKIKEQYGRRLSFWGCVGTQTTMPHGTPKEVRDCVHHLFKTVGRGGGFICAPSHILEPEVPWENIEAFVRAVKECVY